ncbi:MAG: response regulator, partial [Planctomycetota bacterium]|nr:response regulator [Planctomycetota bacterium]
VIMISMVDNQRMGFTLGATEYMTKPIERERLTQIMNKHRCASPPCSVLVVEDDSATREVFRRMLQKDGWSVTEAENGKVALERLKEINPDIILLDLMMPVMDGFEFVQELRKVESRRSIPIVVVTAKDISDEDRRRLTGNVEKVLQKGSYERNELLEQVRSLISTCSPGDGDSVRDGADP